MPGANRPIDRSHQIDLDSMVGDVLSQRDRLQPRIFDLNSTALLIIDMQYLDASREYGLGQLAKQRGVLDLLKYRFDRIDFIVPRIKNLAGVCREVGIQVIHVKTVSALAGGRDATVRMRGLQCVEGSREAAILDELTPESEDIVVAKTTSSAFTSTNLDWILHNLAIKTLLGAGIVTSGCVELTMRDAGDRGYYGIVIDDGCGANSQALHQGAIERMSHGMLTVTSSEQVIAEIRNMSDRSVRHAAQ